MKRGWGAGLLLLGPASALGFQGLTDGVRALELKGERLLQWKSLGPGEGRVVEKEWRMPGARVAWLDWGRQLMEVVSPSGPPLLIHLGPQGRMDSGAPGFRESVDRATREDPARWITIDGPILDQLALAQLLRIVGRGISRDPRGSLGPFGATNDRYRGRVFWDADLWMLPALLPLDPLRAKRISNYRLTGADEARRWADVLAGNRFPRLRRNPPPIDPFRSRPTGAIRYPWEGDGRGREAGETDSRFQEHITASVVLGLRMARAHGLADPSQVKRISAEAAVWYRLRGEKGPGGWELKGVMSPDESVNADNDLYTNMAAEAAGGPSFRLPRDAKTFLAFDRDPLLGYKQAAALLTLFPLQDERAIQEAVPLLQRFQGKSTRNGPAMSLSLYALLEARHRNPDRALDLWRESWGRYSGKGIFSEAPVGDQGVFLTGAAGCLNAILYGFLNLDPLNPGKPRPLRLPSSWKSVTLAPPQAKVRVFR